MQRKVIEQKIHEIARTINKRTGISEDYGLLNGLGGYALFLYHYEKLYSTESQQTNQTIENMIISTAQFAGTHSYCSGVSGVCYLLEYFKKKQFIEVDIDQDTTTYISEAVDVEIKNSNYEFLYGLMGITNYMLTNIDLHYNDIKKIIEYLNTSKEVYYINCQRHYRWPSPLEGNSEYNLSLSHGISSIVVILSKIYKTCLFDQEVIKDLLIGTINYILSQRINVDEVGSFFSYKSDINGSIIRKSRLAWCYGDLGIAVSVYQAGIMLHNRDWVSESLKILRYSAINRRSLEDNLVCDAGICHGTAGLAHVFYKMWWNTNDLAFKSATDYWINKTIEMSSFDDGLAGYKSLHYNTYWVNNASLLEGIAGIGLVLLSYLESENSDWEQCILLP